MQYSIAEYRDKLYSEIVKRKKELRRLQKDREAREGVPAEDGRHRHRHRSSRSARADSRADPELAAAAGGDQEPLEHREQRDNVHREHRHHQRSSKGQESRPAAARVEI